LQENNKRANIILSGGGIKGIAYVGAYETAEKRGYTFDNIAGVSAGALAGAYMGAGYNSQELFKIMEEFDFGKIGSSDISKKVPAVSRYLEHRKAQTSYRRKSVEHFLNQESESAETFRVDEKYTGYRSNLIKSAISLSKEGCLFDGDFLEEWVSNTLQKRGIRTFGDLKHGIPDKVNPGGYKVRMTAVDSTRWKVIVLPDDMAFYGIDPDEFEVAKAVRMSTSVPFAFKPVEIKKQTGDTTSTYHIVDGGVLDDMPAWIMENSNDKLVIGFKLKSEPKVISMDTPLNALKYMVTLVHNTGIPKHINKLKNIVDIDTSDVSFLDFNLAEKDKIYLYRMGRYYANLLFNKMESRYRRRRSPLQIMFMRLFGWN